MAKKNRAGKSKGALSPDRAVPPIGVAALSQALVRHFSASDYRRLQEEAIQAIEWYPGQGFFWKARGVAEWCLGQDAVPALERAAALLPEDAEVLANLGNALVRGGRPAAGIARLQAALARAPGHPVFLTNLGNALYADGRFYAAVTCHRQAVAANPGFAEAWLNLAVALLQMPDANAEAISAARRAIECNPALLAAWDCLLFGREYAALPQDAESLLIDALGYAEQLSGALPPPRWLPIDRKEGGLLRLGLVSGDLRDHVVGRAVLNLAPHFAAAGAEFVVYANNPLRDEVSDAIAAHAVEWRVVVGSPDDALAECVMADRIDVLIDLSGHTQLNRLGLFARRPAPLQVSWLGGCASAGLPQIDWLIGDHITLPPEEESHWVEPVWRLPGPYYTLPPRELPVEVGPLPAIRNGYPTFGCFNNLAKLSDAAVALWARLLGALPAARLVLKTRELGDPAAVEATLARFTRHGIAEERIRCLGASPLAEYLSAFGEIDISLDPCPFPGGATTFDSLWMGVPVLTLRGRRFIGHQGETLLTHAGLTDWIADDEDDFVAQACARVADLPALAELRASLRQRFLHSPLVDGRQNAFQLVDACRQMQRLGHPPAKFPETPAALEKYAALLLQIERWDDAAEGFQRLHAVAVADARRGEVGRLAAYLGIAHQGAGRLAEAIEWYRQALPEVAAGVAYTVELNLGVCLFQQEDFPAAARHAMNAERCRPGDPVALRNAASALIDCGDVEAALACYRRGGIDHPLLASGYLYALNFLPESSLDPVVEAHRRWGALARRVALQRLAAGGLPEPLRSSQPPTGRPWRIGWVSADWRQHPVGFFAEGLLHALADDPATHRLVLYSDVRCPDAVTERFRLLAHSWVDTGGMDDATLARRVREDGIDVLIDLAGHTGERASFFAGRHAPLQLSWLGYAATSGLASIDGVLSDRLLDPPGQSEQHYVEQLYRLGDCWVSYSPPAAGPEIGPPGRKERPPVFASFNRLCKINAPTVACWTALLRAIPGSRLLLVGKGFERPAGRGRLAEWLSAGGIDEERIDWRGACGFDDYLALHGEVDALLDCLPWAGHTVTLHAAWMGVPTLAIEGDHRAGRLAAATMRLLELDQWVVPAGPELAARYAARGVELAARAAWPERAALRQRLLASPLCDARRLARDFDAALDAAWRCPVPLAAGQS